MLPDDTAQCPCTWLCHRGSDSQLTICALHSMSAINFSATVDKVQKNGADNVEIKLTGASSLLSQASPACYGSSDRLIHSLTHAVACRQVAPLRLPLLKVHPIICSSGIVLSACCNIFLLSGSLQAVHRSSKLKCERRTRRRASRRGGRRRASRRGGKEERHMRAPTSEAAAASLSPPCTPRTLFEYQQQSHGFRHPPPQARARPHAPLVRFSTSSPHFESPHDFAVRSSCGRVFGSSERSQTT